MAGGTDNLLYPRVSTEIFLPASHLWRTGPSMHAPRFDHTATPLAGGKVMNGGSVPAPNPFLPLATDATEAYVP